MNSTLKSILSTTAPILLFTLISEGCFDETPDNGQHVGRVVQSLCGPYIEMTKSSYAEHEDIVVHFNNLPGNNKDWLGLYETGELADSDSYLEWHYTEGANTGTIVFSAMKSGQYEARLFFDNSYDLEYAVSFTVGSTQDSCDGMCSSSCLCGDGEGDCDSDDDCQEGLYCEQRKGTDYCRAGVDSCGNYRLEVSQSSYRDDEDIVVFFRNLPGNSKDWVGLYESGASQEDYLSWFYTNGANNGSLVFSGMSPGQYEARLFFDNSYDLEYSVSFTVSCAGMCRSTCLCGDGEGDCDSDTDCQEGLYCEQTSGTDYCRAETPSTTCGHAMIKVSKSAYLENEDIVIHFYNLPGNKKDWVGLYEAKQFKKKEMKNYLAWERTEGKTTGTMVFSGRNPGKYMARLFFNNSYNLEFTVSFSVEDSNQCTDDTPRIELPDSSFRKKEGIVIHLHDLPGNEKDWVGIFEAGK